ncbi:peptidase inhibitor 16-like [Strongylocentrotus purpuratus]|uniref:SCP domain-containing protein n=1 Tax=Strongylocentrotus purpuratus TaxID=7668 RepID=A0A7M7LVR2_STRPU|nr:peptidase inhibitor 16-like [Strongylocentrotus purpuratus]|eukprot:XP_011664985.1 PREDICTED: peptidase inhibitor 16-like [Strongylocentrotus purpuratus]
MIRASCLLLLAVVSLGLAHEPKGMLAGMLSASPEGRPKRDVSVQGLTEAEKSNLLARHNMHRGDVSPSASNMVVLQWNDEIAKDAQDWANTCIWDHNPSEDRETDQWEWVGQNLAKGYGYTMYHYVDSWNEEKEYYNYNRDTCKTGESCGHYTQVAWAETQFIGCGWNKCGKYDHLVCHYGPGGNYRGERPYEEGTSCSQCPWGYRGGCSDKLCKMS